MKNKARLVGYHLLLAFLFAMVACQVDATSQRVTPQPQPRLQETKSFNVNEVEDIASKYPSAVQPDHGDLPGASSDDGSMRSPKPLISEQEMSTDQVAAMSDPGWAPAVLPDGFHLASTKLVMIDGISWLKRHYVRSLKSQLYVAELPTGMNLSVASGFVDSIDVNGSPAFMVRGSLSVGSTSEGQQIAWAPLSSLQLYFWAGDRIYQLRATDPESVTARDLIRVAESFEPVTNSAQ